MSLLAILFVMFAVMVRLAPQHLLHFTPVAASLLFFGAKAPRKYIWAPVALFAASDFYLTVYRYGYSFSWEYLATFAWYAAMIVLGSSLLRNRESVLRTGGAAITASVSFFVISNGMVWAFSGMYPKNAGGLMASYVAGVPFFWPTAASDLCFTAAIFGMPHVIRAITKHTESHGTATA